MNVNLQDLADAGRLVAWSAKPKERPARNGAYAELVHRYFDDNAFAELVHSYAAGLDLHVTVDRVVGVIAVAEPESPLRLTATDFHQQLKSTQRKATTAAALLGVFRVAFPAPAHLDNETRVPQISVGSIVAYLSDAVAQMAADATDAPAGAAELREVWRVWAALPQGRSGAERSSVNTASGQVRKVCEILESQGMLARIDGNGESWRGTPRLRVAARTLAEDSDIYQALLGYDTTPAGADLVDDAGDNNGE